MRVENVSGECTYNVIQLYIVKLYYRLNCSLPAWLRWNLSIIHKFHPKIIPFLLIDFYNKKWRRIRVAVAPDASDSSPTSREDIPSHPFGFCPKRRQWGRSLIFARINGRGCRRFHWLLGMEPTPALKKELLLSVPLNIGHLLLGIALIWDSIWQYQHGINLACGEQKILIWPRHNIFQSGLNLGFWVLDHLANMKFKGTRRKRRVIIQSKC